MKHNKIRNILLLGLFVALEVILTRFFSVENQFVRITFSFIPLAVSAILFGPVMAGIAAAVADVLGMIIFPKAAFFPGFTLTAFLTGFLYGVFLYKKEVTIIRTFFAVLAVTVICSLTLNTIWLVIMYNKGAIAVLTARLIKDAIFIPIQTVTIYFTWKLIGNAVTKSLNPGISD